MFMKRLCKSLIFCKQRHEYSKAGSIPALPGVPSGNLNDKYFQMKNLSIVIIFLVAGSGTSIGQSMLKVSLRDNTTQISVSVDNRYFNRRGTSVTVGELPYGRHSLKIYSMVHDRRGRGYEEVIYNGMVKTYNGMISLLVFDPVTESTDLQEMEIDAYMANHPASNRGRFSGTSQADYNAEYSGSRNNGQADNRGQMTETTNANSQDEPASPIPADQLGTLTDSKYDDLKKKASEQETDTKKLTVLKDELKNERVNTSQVADMMDWFTFEASKVEFAKWAYSITADKAYYSDLENKFSYKASQDELDKFIREQK